jgi:hypothetical protein
MKKLPILIAALCLTPALHAGVGIDIAESSANLDYSSSIGPMSDSKDFEDSGTDQISLVGARNLSDDNDGAGPNFLFTTVRFDLGAANSYVYQSDQYLNIFGGADASISYDQDGFWSSSPGTEPTTSATSAAPGCQTRRRFTVTGDPLPWVLTAWIDGLPLTGKVVLSAENPLGADVVIWQADTQGQSSWAGDLAPGNYWITAQVETDTDTEATQRGSVSFDLRIGSENGTIPMEFPIGAYSYGSLGTDYTNPGKLTIESPDIVSQVSQGDGTTLVTVRAKLANSSECPWSGTVVEIPATFPGGPDVTIQPANSSLLFPTIEANSTGNTPYASMNTIEVLVADADLPAFNASILSGERFTTRGRELWVFIHPVILMGEHNFPGSDVGKFLWWTPLTYIRDKRVNNTGSIFIEDSADPFPLLREIDPSSMLTTGVGGSYEQHSFDKTLPFLVRSSNYDPFKDETTLIANTSGGLFTVKPTLVELISHGTIIDTYEFPHPSGLDVSDGARGEPIPGNHPIHFNRIPIGDHIELSGSLFFKPGKMGVRAVVEDRVIKEFAVTGEFDAAYTLLLETKGPANNVGAPLAEQETTLFSAPIFSIILPSGITLTPTFSTDLGAAVSASTALAIPIETKLHVSFTAGVRDGVPFYEQTPEITPPAVSPPALFQQLGATAEAWLKPELEMRVGAGSVGVGPTFGAKLRGNFGLEPGETPWWSLESNLDLLGGIEFDLANIVTFFDAEQVLETIPLFSSGAGTPTAAARSIVLPDNPGIRPEEGANTRWARVARYPNTAIDDASSFIFPVPGTTDLIVGGPGDLSRYAADGTLKWSLTPPLHSFIDAVPEDDEGFTILANSQLALYRCDAAGKRLWLTHLTPSSGALFPIDLARRIHPVSGVPEYLVTGWFREFGARDALVVIKFDQNGTLLWSKKHAAVPADAENTDTNALSATLTAAGDLLVTGFTNADLAGATPLFNIPGKPLLVKISGDDGSVLWANALCTHRGGSYHCAVESPTGEIYAGGECAVTVLDDIPPMTLSKFAADGSLLDSIVLGSASSEGAEEPIYDQGPVPNGGQTVFDVVRAMAWRDGHLWIGGTIGTGSADFSLSSGRGAFTARLTGMLAVDRFAIHEIGPDTDAIISLADAGDGLLACGYSRSILPWPGASPAQDARLVMKLPDEGILRFHDISAAAQPDQGTPLPTAGSHYIYPRTAAGSDVSNYAADAGSGIQSSYPVSFTTSELTLVAANFPPPPPVFTTPLDHHQLDYVPPQVVTDLQTYLDWNQVDATEDRDNDGMDAEAEFFFGSDVFAFDPVTPSIEYLAGPGGDSVVLTVPRAKLAAPQLPAVYDSGDLTNWFLRTDVTDTVTPFETTRDWLHLTLPVFSEDERRFYQLGTP